MEVFSRIESRREYLSFEVAVGARKLVEEVMLVRPGEDVVITKRGKPVASLIGRERTKQQVDLDWLRKRTMDMTLQEEDSGTFMRRVRDTDRY